MRGWQSSFEAVWGIRPDVPEPNVNRSCNTHHEAKRAREESSTKDVIGVGLTTLSAPARTGSVGQGSIRSCSDSLPFAFGIVLSSADPALQPAGPRSPPAPFAPAPGTPTSCPL